MLYRLNPHAMLPGESAFTEGDFKRLQDYQANVGVLPPDELNKRLDPTQNPARLEAIRKVEEEGRRLASDPSSTNSGNFIGIDQVLRGLAGQSWWQQHITGGGTPGAPTDPVAAQQLMNDFYTLFGERYAVSGNMDTAKTQALQRLQRKYGATDVNSGGSTIMAYPPEWKYPIVNGDHAWMGEQLQEFVDQQAPGSVSHSIIETPQTEADISAGLPPSYNVGVMDKNGTFRLLTSPADGSTNVRFDPDKALADSRAAFQAKRAKAQAAASAPPFFPSIRFENNPSGVFGDSDQAAPVSPTKSTPAFGSGGPTLP